MMPEPLSICPSAVEGVRRGGAGERRARTRKRRRPGTASRFPPAACLPAPPALPPTIRPQPRQTDRQTRARRGRQQSQAQPSGVVHKGKPGGGGPPYLQRFKSDKAGHGKSINDVLFGRGGLSPLPSRGSGPGRGGGRGLPIVFLVGARRRSKRGRPGPASPAAAGRAGPQPAPGAPLPVSLRPRPPLFPESMAPRRAIHGSAAPGSPRSPPARHRLRPRPHKKIDTNPSLPLLGFPPPRGGRGGDGGRKKGERGRKRGERKGGRGGEREEGRERGREARSPSAGLPTAPRVGDSCERRRAK